MRMQTRESSKIRIAFDWFLGKWTNMGRRWVYLVNLELVLVSVSVLGTFKAVSVKVRDFDLFVNWTGLKLMILGLKIDFVIVVTECCKQTRNFLFLLLCWNWLFGLVTLLGLVWVEGMDGLIFCCLLNEWWTDDGFENLKINLINIELL